MTFSLHLSITPIEGCHPDNQLYKVWVSQELPDGREIAARQTHPPTMLFEFIQGQLNNNLRQLLNELEVELKKRQTEKRRQANNE